MHALLRIALLLSIPLVIHGISAAAADQPLPAASTFAPAEQLSGLIDEHFETMAKQLASEDAYREAGPQLARTAHTLSVVALALALSNETVSGQSSAGAMLGAAQALAEASDFAAATSAWQALQAARQNSEQPLPTAWEAVAPTGELMTQVQATHNRLKRSTRGARFESLAADNARAATLLAIIAHEVRADENQIEDAEQLPQWQAYCDEMRDSASALRTAITSGDRAAADSALTRLENNCKDCHKVFHPDEP
jgi:hypothetical protein